MDAKYRWNEGLERVVANIIILFSAPSILYTILQAMSLPSSKVRIVFTWGLYGAITEILEGETPRLIKSVYKSE